MLHGSKIKVLVDSDKGLNYRIPAYIKRVVQDEDTKNFTGQLWFAENFEWSDDAFDFGHIEELFIYECHIGMAQEKEALGSYLEFAEIIATDQRGRLQRYPGHGHAGASLLWFFWLPCIQLLCTFIRFGTPEDLKFLIKKAHEMGIGVIMDIVHSHTVKNIIEGINQFDGSESQYFHEGAGETILIGIPNYSIMENRKCFVSCCPISNTGWKSFILMDSALMG